MGFWDEYNKALLDDTPKKSSGGSGSSGGGASNYWSEYNKVISSGPVAKPAVYRPGVDARSRITLPLRHGTTKSKITTLPHRSGSGSNERTTLPNRVGKDDDQTDAPIRDKVDSRLTVDNKKDEEEDKEKKWYEKGHFEDGWDFGDITKTILGIDEDTASLKDLTINSAKRGYYNSLYGEETFKEIFGEENQKDVYKEKLESDEYQFTPGNDLASGISGAFELVGQMARQYTNPRTLAMTGGAAGLAFAAGQAGPQIALPEEVLTVPSAALYGFKTGSALSNLEIEAGHAYNEMIEMGVKEDIAKKIALGVGAGNAALEFAQLGNLEDAFKTTAKKEGTEAVWKLMLKELQNRGVDVFTETAQEVGQELVTIGGVQAANYLDKGEFAYSAEEVGNRLWDTTKSSALTFGMMNVPATAKNTYSIVSDQHKANSLTANEQAVVNKEVENRIAKKDGNVSSREKARIYDQVVSDMEKGRISIETIEEVLGGEAYEKYNAAMNNQKDNDFLESYEALRTKTGATAEDVLNLSEMRPMYQSITDYRNQTKNELSSYVSEFVRGDRLSESYNEIARRKQKYEADLSKYDAKQQEIVQKAIDSGVLNNTNRSHEFVDVIAKIHAEKDIPFDFTNNAKLKESGFAIEGATVDGFVNENGITINMESPKAWQTTVGHEISHVLEGTEFYSELQNVLFEYAKPKGDYKARYDTLHERYKEVYKDITPEEYEAKINAEVTADLIGEYLFTDENFVNNLSATNRNVFQKVYDEIKYLYKVATAGSKEARDIERIKKVFDKAYRGSGNAQLDTDVKYKIYSRPDFTKDEWSIVNRKKFAEFDNPKYTLDTDRNWMYFNEKGMNGFAIYSKADAEDPTVLYGSRGKKAEQDYNRLNRFFEEGQNYAANNRTTFDRILNDIKSSKRSTSDGVSPVGDGGTAIGDVFLPFGEPRSDRGRDFGDGTEVGRNEALTEYNDEASDVPGASFITFSNDYATIRNFMKEGDTEYSLSDNPDNPNGYSTPASDLMYAPTVAENATVSETENVAPTANPVEFRADNSELTTPAPTFPERAELDVLKDERKVLEDTLMSMVTVGETGEKFQELSKKWSEVNRKIEAIENNLTDGEGSTGDIAPAQARTDAPYFVSEDVASIVDKMVTQDTEAGEGTFADPYVVYSVDDYVIQRRISRDGQKYSYTIITPDGAFRRGLVDQNAGAFYADIADKITNLMMEAEGYNNEVDTVDESDYPNGVAATAPVRVVSTDKGDYLKTDNDFDEKGYSPINKIPGKQARILTEQPKIKKTDSTKTENTQKSDSLNVDTSKKGKMSPIKMIEEYIIDNGFVFEKLSKKTKNRSLEAKWNFTRYSRGMAQHLIAHGSKADNVQSLKSIADKVDKAGLTQDFYNYLGHYRNIDGMTLDVRYNTTNKGVFGNDVTAAMSQTIVDSLEKQHPEFKEWADEVYAYNNYLLDMSVDGGLITQKLADRLKDMYPHYVPISRVGVENEIKSDNSEHVGVNSPVKHATGGNQDILPFFDTMANRTLATFNAVNMNDFGVELFSTLYPGRSTKNTSLDPTYSNVGMKVEDLDSLFDPQAELLQLGENGKNPTFSVFMDGERHTFDISHEMYEAMKPANDVLSYKIPVLSQVSNLRRQLITEYNPWFMLKNAIKDSQDVLINSQHALKTYGEMLFEAPMELFTQGQWYQEYMANGGDQNTYFEKDNISLKGDKKVVDTIKKFSGLEAISKANNFIETLPRLAEYIASRKSGRSIQVSMLDAARVTTNFAAGGQATKFLNRNGATFLNASVQGTTQFIRNFAEAKQNGLKGWASLAARMTAAGIVPVVLNHLMWDDDEEYQELPDYITNNYYVIGKYGDGQFVRIPKGRVAAVLQNAVEQVARASSGNDEADWEEFYKLVVENIAPNNPATDNIFAPIGQVINNKTWYGEDMIPYRLKDLPTVKQFDEKTSSVSVWLSEKLQDIPMTKWMDLSPKEIHYLMDQYSGVVGDTLLPFFTPKAESPNDSTLGKMIAPLRDIFTTDSVLNSRVTGDFYETLEAAEAKAESEDATLEDKFRSGMLIGYNVEISKLMQEQRDIQTSDLPDSEKYKRNRELKEQINALQKKGLDSLDDYSIDGIYAEAGDKRYNYDSEKDTWWEVKPTTKDGEDNYYIMEQLYHDKLGVDYADYWNGRLNPEEFDVKSLYGEYGDKRFNFGYDSENDVYRWFKIEPKTKEGEDNYYYQKEQTAHNEWGVSYEDFWNNREAYMDAIYVAENGVDDGYGTPYYETVKSAIGLETFTQIASDMADLKADTKPNGDYVRGSKKRKVKSYIYSLDIPDIQKHILFKAEYPEDRSHAREIVKYLDRNEDISYDSYWKILDELGYKYDSKGYVTW